MLTLDCYMTIQHLLFDSTVLYVEDYYNDDGDQCYYKIPTDKKEPLKKPFWTLKANEEMVSYVSSGQMLFDEKQKTQAYYWMLDPESNKDERKEGEDYYFLLAAFTVGDNSEQKPKTFKKFNTGHIYCCSEVFSNRDFSKIMMLDGVDYRSPMVFDIASQTVLKIELGTDISICKNWWLRDNFLCFYQDHLGVRWIYEQNTGRKVKSNFNGWYFRINDCKYSQQQKKFLEIKDDGHTGLKVGVSDEKDQSEFSMQEISRMGFKHPYMIFCKGSQQIIIRSFDRIKESIILQLEKDEIFMSFLNVDSNHYLTHDTEADVMYPNIPQEKIDMYEQTRGSHSVNLYYMTSSPKGICLHALKMFPYAKEEGNLMEKFIYKTILRKNDLPIKEIISANLTVQSFSKYNVVVEMSNLVIQFPDSIIVKSLLQDYSFAVSKFIAPLTMIQINLASYEEFLYITNERDGSKIRMITYIEGTTDVSRTKYKQPGIKIISFCKRDTNIFIIDENLTCKVFGIENTDSAKCSKLIPKHNLEMSQFTKQEMEDTRDTIFTPFHRAHYSLNNGLHISDQFFQFFTSAADALSYNTAEEMAYIQRTIDSETRTYLRGPFDFKDSRDNLAYYYQDWEGNGAMFFMNCLGSKLNFIADCYVAFASFLETEMPKEERMLVQIGVSFFIFRPNGQIHSEVAIKDKKLSVEVSLSIRDVSDNMKFFVFNYIPKVFQLVHDEDKDLYSFKAFKKMALIPQKNDFKVLQDRKEQQTSADFTNKLKKTPLTSSHPQNKATKGVLPIQELPEDNSINILKQKQAENAEEAKQKDDEDDGYVSEEIEEDNEDYQYVEGSLQIGDDGAIWNLYFNKKEEKAYLRVDRKNLEARYIPELVHQHLKADIYASVKTVLVDRYLVIALQMERPYIYYLRVDTLRGDIISTKTREIKLQMSTEWTFENIRHVNSINRIQINLSNPTTNITAIVTWNLKKNLEDRALEIKGEASGIRISKGVNSCMNYVNVNTICYDIEYGFPLKFFADTSSLYIYSEFFENTLSEGKDLLVLKDSYCLMCSVTLSEIQRRFLSQYEDMKNSTLQKKSFPITMTSFRTQDGSNIFHFLVTDFKTLKTFHENYMKLVDDCDDEDKMKEYLELYLLILYPNMLEVTPFDIALKKSSQYVDLFLRMLTKVPDYQLSRYIFSELKVFRQLMQMGIPSFESFLNRCLFQSATMQIVQTRYWKHGDKERYISQANSSIITVPFCRELIGRAEDDPEEEELKKLAISMKGASAEELKAVQTSQIEEKAVGFSDVRSKKFAGIEVHLGKESVELKSKEKLMGGQKRRIEIAMVEFDWVFRGDEGRFFIEQLSEAPSDDIFKVETIKICLEFLWEQYFFALLMYVQIPYTVFFVTFLIYSSTSNEERGEKESILNLVLGCLDLVYCVYTIGMEIRQAIIQGTNYYTSSSLIWNIIDICSTISVIATIVADFSGVATPKTLMAVSSLAVFFLWLKFFYFLRIFSATAAFIRMITEILKDMGVFCFIYMLANLAFANAFFLLEGGFTDILSEEELVTGSSWWRVLIYTYMTGLGEFETEYKGVQNEPMYWIYFFFCSVFIQVLLLNLLIAIMGDTFSRVQEIKAEAELKERCKLISENWFWVRQNKVFKRTKYIAVARLEKADDSTTSAWEGQIAVLKNFFSVQITGLQRQLKAFKIEQKHELGLLQKSLSLKIQNQATSTNTQFQSTEQFQLEVRKSLMDLTNNLKKA